MEKAINWIRHPLSRSYRSSFIEWRRKNDDDEVVIDESAPEVRPESD